LPARLAVGLGLESGLETGCPASFAPSSNHFEEFGSPAPGFRKEARLRLLWADNTPASRERQLKLARRFGSYETNIPPLSDRAEDLRAMILDRVARLGLTLRGEPFATDDAVLDELLNYEWPGNESELESALQLLVQHASESLIHLDDLESIGFGTAAPRTSEPASSPATKVLRPPQRRIARRQR